MAVLNIVGFETGDTREAATVIGAVAVQSATVRPDGGRYALRVSPTGSGTAYVNIGKLQAIGTSMPLSMMSVVVRSYFMVQTLPASNEQILIVLGSGAKLDVRIDATGMLTVQDSTGRWIGGSTTRLQVGTWYRIDVYCETGTAATCQLRVNGAMEIAGTCNLGTSPVMFVSLGKYQNKNNSGYVAYYDDVAVEDTNWPEEGHVVAVTPARNGMFFAWTGGPAEVDEIPHDGDGTYLRSAGMDHTFLGSTAAAGVPSDATINAIKAVATVRDEGNAAARVAVEVGQENGFRTTTPMRPGTTYVTLQTMIDPPPPTPSGVDTYEFGVWNGQTGILRCTQALLMVDFGPPLPVAPPTAAIEASIFRRRRT